MRITKNFGLINKEKIIIWSLISSIGLFALGIFIATCWYNFDRNSSETMYKAMDSMFLRVWACYTVSDGYTSIIPFMIPVGLIAIENFLAWCKFKNKNGFFARVQTNIKWVYIVILTLFTIVMVVYEYQINYVDQGFGNMFSMEFVLSPEYMWPIISISFVVNMAIAFVSAWIVRTKIASKKNFLEERYWIKCITIFFFLLYAYFFELLLKKGLGRPYYYQLIWDRVLEKVDKIDPLAKQHYLDNADKFNLSWVDLNNQDWPWWKTGTGFFGRSVDPTKYAPKWAFPSGHMDSTMAMMMVTYFLLGKNSKSKKFNKWKWIAIAVSFIYLFDVIFALQTSLSHWLSDMAFSLAVAPILIIASIYTSKAIGIRISDRVEKVMH